MSGKTGETIKAIRKSLGYTQTDVAEKLFTTAQNISRIESGEGEPTVEMLLGLAELFDVSVDTLLCRGELPESELLHRVRGSLKRADRDELPGKVFRVCKQMLCGRFDAALGDREVRDVPTYVTMTARNLTGVFSDRPGRPPVFAAVGTNTAELRETSGAAVIEVFGALADREVLRVIGELSRSPRNGKFYDKPSFCSAFGVDEPAFAPLAARLSALKLLTEKTVVCDGSRITVYRPSLNHEIVLLLSLADLLYTASPDGSAH